MDSNKIPAYFDQANNNNNESLSENKTDLIDRLASSKSFNNIWISDNETNKTSIQGSNSLPVENLINK